MWERRKLGGQLWVSGDRARVPLGTDAPWKKADSHSARRVNSPRGTDTRRTRGFAHASGRGAVDFFLVPGHADTRADHIRFARETIDPHRSAPAKDQVALAEKQSVNAMDDPVRFMLRFRAGGTDRRTRAFGFLEHVPANGVDTRDDGAARRGGHGDGRHFGRSVRAEMGGRATARVSL